MMATKAKKMTTEDLRAKTEDELSKMVLDLKKQQFNQRFQKSGGQMSNTSEIRKVRRDIARIKTIVTEKKAGAVAAPAKAKAAKPAAKAPAKTPAKAKATKKATA